MSWKNGLGITTELEVYPPGSDFAKGNFLWRLSCARIEADNQFSEFTGYDRKLVVLSGDGLILNDLYLPPFHVHSFRGEDQIQCSLVKKVVEDLGIIYKRDSCQCRMDIVELPRSARWEMDQGIHFITSLKGVVACDEIELGDGDFLRFEGPGDVVMQTPERQGLVLCISIRS
ncbi:MAG: HutD family protein [Bdellovibrionaceae bacterium]|nr:HutD family protein [Pseudobdellovibrionaceae bacterium]